jgi:hypothetical protein
MQKVDGLRSIEPKEGKKYSKEQREENRMQIASLRLRGLTFPEIAAEVNLSVSEAYREYKVVEQRWRVAAFDDLAELKARELARIDLIEQEAWRAYERSQEMSIETRQSFVQEDGRQELVGAMGKKTNRDGDAKWLRVILECVDKRVRLLGLDSPDLRGGAHGGTAPNDQSLTDRLARYQGVLAFRIDAIPDGVVDHARLGESVDSERPPSEAGRVFDVDGRVREAAP